MTGSSFPSDTGSYKQGTKDRTQGTVYIPPSVKGKKISGFQWGLIKEATQCGAGTGKCTL